LSTEGRQSLDDWLGERVEEKVAEDPFQRDEAFIESMIPLLELWCRYFDAEVRGLETLPERGPMLLVGNHSGGNLVPDTAVTMLAWFRERGLDDPLIGLAMDGVFGIPGFETLMRKLGQIPASHDNAEKALRAGHSVLVYPGGAKEAFRPWTDRNRIEFSGHRGFVRLALRAGVPVVPVVAHGGHHSTFVLTRGDAFAKRLGLERLKLHIAPLLLQVPWGLSLGLIPGVPLPAKIDVEVGPPIDWSVYGPEAADDPEIVDRCYDEITTKMQHTLDRLARSTPYPVAQRLLELLPFSLGQRDDDGGGEDG
jgi:1-acyl-sn-glycerol-3-phosphate acyltransferase